MKLRRLAFSMILCLAACGSEMGGVPGGDDDAPPPSDGAYLPLAIGNHWTWRVTPSTGAPYDKVNQVEALEDVGGAKQGTMAFRVRTSGSGGDTVSWQQ